MTTTNPLDRHGRGDEPARPHHGVASGFMAAKHLFAANELGPLRGPGRRPRPTLDALAARTGLTRRAARISADAMVALACSSATRHLPQRRGRRPFLAGRRPADLRPFLRFWDKISYPAWTRLAEALASGPPREIFELDDELQQVASAGIEAILAGPATALAARSFDFGRTSGCSTSAAAPVRGPSPSPSVTRTSPATVLELPSSPRWPAARSPPQGSPPDQRGRRRRHGGRTPRRLRRVPVGQPHPLLVARTEPRAAPARARGRRARRAGAAGRLLDQPDPHRTAAWPR